MIKILFLFLFLSFPFITLGDTIPESMFGLDSAHIKLVNNKGEGYSQLNGVRNFRVVLINTVYRGGGKNTINMNPLPYEAINNLRKIGFSKAIYLYYTNFNQQYPKSILDSLQNINFNYICRPSIDENMLKEYFNDVLEVIKNPEIGPIYIHCWNGWHQSGVLSAYTLIQFCGISNDQALKYWEICAYPNNIGYEGLKSKIKNFKPYPEFFISKKQKERICPCLK